MATASQRTPREVIDFAPNVTMTVALKFAQPKIVSGQYGERYMFTTTDDRVMFLDPPVAGQIAQLGVNVRESLAITKRWDGRRESTPTWEVTRAGEQSDGTYIAPKLPTPAAPVAAAPPEPAAVDRVPPKPPSMASAPTRDAVLVDAAKALVDEYAEVLEYGLKKHEGRVKPDEIRNLLVTACIQRERSRGAA